MRRKRTQRIMTGERVPDLKTGDTIAVDPWGGIFAAGVYIVQVFSHACKVTKCQYSLEGPPLFEKATIGA